MSSSAKRKSEKLGMPYGTARNKLVKSLLWSFICRQKQNYCHQCGSEILSIDDLSIEHIEPWENSINPVKLYFDIDNIAYSHLSCNSSARILPKQPCPSRSAYTRGCRCEDCKELNRVYAKENYSKERRRNKYLKHGY